jgi:hypothetical protein
MRPAPGQDRISVPVKIGNPIGSDSPAYLALTAAREDVAEPSCGRHTGDRRCAGLCRREFPEDRVRLVNSRTVPALRRRDRTGARSAPG